MDTQTLIVTGIIGIAVLFFGNMIWRKVRAMRVSAKNCGTDCGCGENSKTRN